jgi:hypothetical protein
MTPEVEWKRSGFYCEVGECRDLERMESGGAFFAIQGYQTARLQTALPLAHRS